MTSPSSKPRRVVIVGGGIAGLSIAVRLGQAGMPVTLLEADELGFGASTRNQGWLYSGAIFAPDNLELARQCYRSLWQTLSFCPDCVEPGQTRMLYLFTEDDRHPDRWTEAWMAAGIPFDALEPEAVREALPDWNPRKIQTAWRLPDRAIRMNVLLEHLAKTAETEGVEIRTGTSVTDLVKSDRRVEGVTLANGEELAAGLVILATGGQHSIRSEVFASRPGEQSSFHLVNLKTHLMAIEPGLGSRPFCVLDHQGFNHIPHGSASIFGSNQWAIVSQAHNTSVDAGEVERLRGELAELLPSWDFSGSEMLEWAGTTVQAMHLEQIEPGRATQPTVIDHEQESGGVANLLSVFPGRASLWPQLAEMALEAVKAKRALASPQVAKPPWQSA